MAPDRLYGTVSQSAIITCASERAVFYAYRETKSKLRAASSAVEGTLENGTERGEEEEVSWTWFRFPLPTSD